MFMSRLDTYFVEVSAHAFLKVATKGSFRGNFRLFFWSKIGGMQSKRLKCLQ